MLLRKEKIGKICRSRPKYLLVFSVIAYQSSIPRSKFPVETTTMNPCEDANDCSNSTIIRECYEENNFVEEVFFCECSNWFGWVGENCDEPSSSIYYNRIMFVFFTIWNLFNIVTISKVIYIYLKYNYKKTGFKNANPVLYVAILVFLSAFCLCILGFTRVISFYDPDQFIVVNSKSLFFESVGVERRLTLVNDFLLLFGGTFQALASVQIILSWLDVFDKMNKIFEVKLCVSEKTLKRIIASTIIFLTILFIILACFEAVAEITFVYVLASLVIAIGYLVGYYRFRSRMNGMLNGSLGGKEKRALRVVKTSFKINTICFTGILFCSLIYYFGFTNHLRILKIGSFNYFLIFTDIAVALGFITLTYSSYYCYRINIRIIKTDHFISWIPFSGLCGILSKNSKSKSNDTMATDKEVVNGVEI